MNQLVTLNGNDIFTDSLVIANGTGIAHRYIKEQIRKYQNRIGGEEGCGRNIIILRLAKLDTV